MRTKSTRQAYLDMFVPSSTTKVVEAYCKKYSALDKILRNNPTLLDLAHTDFVRWLSDSDDGRESRYSSEELLRAVVLMFLEQDRYRDMVVRIETSEFLRSFIGLGFCKPMMDFTLVSKAFSAMSADTWKAMNEVLGQNVQAVSMPALADLLTLEHFAALAGRVIDQAQRRVFQGEKVPADEKRYSIFEEHVELLMRGKAGKPVEFGHLVVLAQTGEKFITHYRSLPEREADPELLPESLAAHSKLFGDDPSVLATDKGFYSSAQQLAALEERIETVSICKKGRLTEEQNAREHTEEF